MVKPLEVQNQRNKLPIQMVSAFASANNLVLVQVNTDEKYNEITTIPKLLELLSIKNTTVTIYGMWF